MARMPAWFAMVLAMLAVGSVSDAQVGLHRI